MIPNWHSTPAGTAVQSCCKTFVKSSRSNVKPVAHMTLANIHEISDPRFVHNNVEGFSRPKIADPNTKNGNADVKVDNNRSNKGSAGALLYSSLEEDEDKAVAVVLLDVRKQNCNFGSQGEWLERCATNVSGRFCDKRRGFLGIVEGVEKAKAAVPLPMTGISIQRWHVDVCQWNVVFIFWIFLNSPVFSKETVNDNVIYLEH